MENETNDDTPNSKPNKDRSPISDNNSDKVIKENKKEGNLYNDTEAKCPDVPPLVVKIQKEKGLTKQDIIAIVSVIISSILFVITLLTFQQTKRSVDISEQAIKETIINDSTMRARDSIKFIKDTVYEIKKFIEDSDVNSKSFEVSKNALEAQINSLKEEEIKFEIQNRPFLETSSATINAFEIGVPIDIFLTVKNLGNYPVEVVNTNIRMATKYLMPDTSNMERPPVSNNITKEEYISKGNDGQVEAFENEPLSTNRFNKVNNGDWKLYVFGIITYKNLITLKQAKFKFMANINPSEKKLTIIYNKN